MVNEGMWQWDCSIFLLWCDSTTVCICQGQLKLKHTFKRSVLPCVKFISINDPFKEYAHTLTWVPSTKASREDHTGCLCIWNIAFLPFHSFNTRILICFLARLGAQVSLGCRYVMPRPSHCPSSGVRQPLHAEEGNHHSPGQWVKQTMAGQDLLCVLL